tara:strand:+ start:115 stop:837 length:723 start_codon:yes stop_codon:yes gene_type:complete
MTRTRPQKSQTWQQAEKNKLSNWIPTNGYGIGIKNGKRVYFRNFKVQPNWTPVLQDLLIENPMGVVRGAYKLSGLKSIVEEPGSLGLIDPRLWLSMGRSRKNLAELGIKPPDPEVQRNIAKNKAKLLLEQQSGLQFDELPVDEKGKQVPVITNNDGEVVVKNNNTSKKVSKKKTNDLPPPPLEKIVQSDLKKLNESPARNSVRQNKERIKAINRAYNANSQSYRSKLLTQSPTQLEVEEY